MVIREPNELNETLRAEDFKDKKDGYAVLTGVIIKAKDLKTNYGDKVVAEVRDGEARYDVFVNNTSMGNLCKAYGKDDAMWKGRQVEIQKQTDEKFKKAMLVIHALTPITENNV